VTPAPFDLANAPLAPGITLLEASAGTGKTFTLAGLFLRLLLEQGLSHRSLLIVTYTEAATEELRGRLRDRLAETLKALQPGAPCTDPQVRALRNRLEPGDPDFRHARARLQQALSGFDETPIRTIHGFCQRLLADRAFESGSLFDLELLTSMRPLLEEVVSDWWRRAFQTMDRAEAGFVLADGIQPGRLRRLLEETQRHPGLKLLANTGPDPLPRLRERLHQTFAEAATLWARDRDVLRACFGDGTGWGNRPYNSTEDMAPALAQLEACLLGQGGVGGFKSFCLFTTEALEAKRKKRGATPQPVHRFFDLCAELERLKIHLSAGWQLQFHRDATQALRDIKATRKVQGFDDLLTRLDEALDGPRGGALADQVARQYPVALIDEFQDTDPVQWRIFRRLFGRPDQRLFLIGDPKQAIYGFRGADIYTYLSAAGAAARAHTLGVNWRSESPLVGAVNRIFQRHPAPFVIPEIRFHPVQPGPKADAAPLTEAGRREAPLRLWFLDGEDESTWSKREAEPILAQATAVEIRRLLSAEAKVEIRGQPLRPRDIAVLVESHQQAERVAAALAPLGIPCVQQTQRSVLESGEAAELLLLMQAISDPSQARRFRAALAGTVLGLGAADLLALQENEEAWSAWVARFLQWRERWEHSGFLPMFRVLLRDLQVRKRWLALPDGERRLTNLLHLAELLHAESVERGLGVAALCLELERRAADPGSGGDTELLRLERDDDAVQLVTIHRSKGLEYPVVFCPFFLRAAEAPRVNRPDDPKLVLCHDPQDGSERRLIGDLGSPDLERHEQLAATERLAEALRLLYVAVTRARNRCYLGWGHYAVATTSPAWLFHAGADVPADEAVMALAAWGKDRTSASTRQALAQLESEDTGIALSSPEVGPVDPWNAGDVPTPPAGPRLWSRTLAAGWRAASFTWFTAGQKNEAPDHDALTATAAPDVPVIVPSRALPQPSRTIHEFPRGARAGVCLHQLFENIEFTSPKTGWTSIIDTLLPAHGMDASFQPALVQLLQDTLSTDLNSSGTAVQLNRIPHTSRLTELEFCFPLRRTTPRTLRDLFARHGNRLPGSFGKACERLEFNPVEGVLRGFIDLVFQADGKWWLADWKSNWLGPDGDAYTPSAVQTEMDRHLYPLQYLLYTLALDRWLTLRVPGYRYERDFGGVRYLFLRGLDPTRPGQGIFADRPAAELIRDLGDLLLPAVEEGTA
jgi:exodeoxyribonuclease V beta subunit